MKLIFSETEVFLFADDAEIQPTTKKCDITEKDPKSLCKAEKRNDKNKRKINTNNKNN